MNNEMYHIIETDFEPDDMIAIAAHANRYKRIDLTIFVGESKPNDKIPMVKKFIDSLTTKYPDAYNSVTIFQGIGSKKS
jgi:hypothetical protein